MKSFLIAVTILISKISFCQSEKINEVALSTNFVWNNTTIFNSYAGARAKDISGNAWSNGVNLNYSKTLYKNFYAKIGIGYFKQKFGIVRGFDFEETVTLTGLGYSTKYYHYKNIQYIIGAGYIKPLPKNYILNFGATYNYLNSFQQEFRNTGSSNFLGNRNPQKRDDNFHFGSYLNFQIGVKKNFYKKISLGLDLICPVYNKWRKDEIFREDVNEFYGSNFLIGTSINLIYQIKKK